MTPLERRSDGAQGYALVAAVACIAVFAAMALSIITVTRISVTAGSGELAAARAHLAADGGLQTALHSLALGEDAALALLGGGHLSLNVNGAQVVVRLADERGKIPLNFLDEVAVGRMLANAGLDETQVAIARDSLLDWLDDDDLARADGAEAPFYAARLIAPRNASLRTIDELAAIRGFTPQLVARLRSYVTVEANTIPFDRRYATPQALAVMADRNNSPETSVREPESSGQRTALDFIDKKALVGRPITITADAATADGGRAHRDLVVVMTGRATYPWVILKAD